MIISESELKKIRHIFSEMIPAFFHHQRTPVKDPKVSQVGKKRVKAL